MQEQLKMTDQYWLCNSMRDTFFKTGMQCSKISLEDSSGCTKLCITRAILLVKDLMRTLKVQRFSLL
jgi:hypothetical protein